MSDDCDAANGESQTAQDEKTSEDIHSTAITPSQSSVEENDTPPTENDSDTDEVQRAVSENDWERLRKLSLRPGGFGHQRVRAWPFLLGVGAAAQMQNETIDKLVMAPALRRRRRSVAQPDASSSSENGVEVVSSDSNALTTHPDEHQIKLDTDRSFVLYPVVNHHANREELQQELNSLITSVFRNRPKLSYFQGFHDIITVIFLTLPSELQLVCAEKMSLHRIRDSMGKGLEPVVGLLRILKYLFRLADPPYAEILEQNTALPYFALSNLLTLFSHDVPTLSQIQHVFDYLLCRPPIASVYLVAAVTLARKDEAIRMVESDEDGMLHSLLTTLPELEDVEIEARTGLLSAGDAEQSHSSSQMLVGMALEAKVENDYPFGEASGQISATSSIDELSAPLGSAGDFDDLSASLASATKTASSSVGMRQLGEGSNVSSNTPSGSRTPDSSDVFHKPHTESSWTPPSSSNRPAKSAVPLSSLLERADELYGKYPPSHPELHIAEIMGPNSVMITWKEKNVGTAGALADDEAENLVGADGVVLPYIDSEDEDTEEDWDESDEIDKSPPPRKRRRLVKRRPPPRPHMHKSSRLRKTLRRLSLGLYHPLSLAHPSMDKKTVATGAVLVLGVAIAMYSVQSRSGNGRMGGLAEILGGGGKDKGRAGKWVVATLLGGSERLLGTFGWTR